MDEKDISGSIMVISEERIDSLCPMVFGFSCAFFALGLLPESEICDNKWSEIRTRMINGRLDLVQKLENAQKQIMELKKRRSEEAKANEKVVSIFAAREQSWFDERRQLRQQIDVLKNDLRLVETRKNETISELSLKLEESEVILQFKDKMIEEVEQKRCETEEKLKKAENLVEELRVEIERYACEVSKTETEVETVMEEKEELMLVNQMLSVDLVRIRKELEHKDRILSALVRKSKLETSEKQMCLLRHTLPKLVHENIEHMKLKDEKLEAFQRQLMKMEVESKRFKSHIEGLDHDIAKLKQDNVKLEAMVLEQNGDGTKSRRKPEISSPPIEETKEVRETTIHGKEVTKGIDIIKRTNSTTWKMDIHSFGVSYKIKRLKQHLIIVKTLNSENSNGPFGTKGLHELLNKQVDRYESLQRKIDNLCKRMNENDEEDETRRLEKFLEEIFQVQRYVVATGQKLMEVEGKIGFGGVVVEKSGNIDMKQFGESVKGLVREVQRGLELQVSRIIGDLTCGGFQ